MSAARKKRLSLIYNGIEAQKELSPYLEKFSYTDSVGESDKISMSLIDRDLKWVNSWIPVKGDVISPSIILENWRHEGEKINFECGSFIVDDFAFSAPPLMGEINGVSAPVNTGFKESENSKTWEAATVQLIATEIASKHGLALSYEANDIPIKKTEQSRQSDSDFLKKICEKYGLGIKVYANRLVIWDFKKYFEKPSIATITPFMISKWSYKSTMQGTYTGARVSYTDPNTKKTVDVITGTQERLYKTTQKADSEAEARIIGESAILNANRKESTMQITLFPTLSLIATANIALSGFGKMDGKYFVEQVSHTIDRKNYNMTLKLSRISSETSTQKETGEILQDAPMEEKDTGITYTVEFLETLWDISTRFYGSGGKCGDIYEANRDVIEDEARKRGYENSHHGYRLFPGTILYLP